MTVFGLCALVRRSKDYIYCKFRGFHFVSIFSRLFSLLSMPCTVECCSFKKEPPQPPRWPEKDVADAFRTFAGCTNVENSPLEEALTEVRS